MNKAYLLIGGNLGNRKKNLEQASEWIQNLCGPILQKSSLYQTGAWGKRDQPDFLNQALIIETAQSATLLMQTLLDIEGRLGRRRKEKYGPRIIDIDILFFNNEVINNEVVTIPHPEIQNRRFALEPLKEIGPELIHPLLKKTITILWKECPDKLDVKKI